MLTFFLAFQNQDVPPPEAGAIAAALLVMGIALLISLGIAIVICALLYSAQTRIPEEHRKIPAGHVWLLLIPLFNLVWNFFVFPRVADSYKSYFNAQGRTEVGDCGRTVGLWYAICGAVSIVPCINYIAGPAALVLLIIYLVKIWSLRGQVPLSSSTPPSPPPAAGA